MALSRDKIRLVCHNGCGTENDGTITIAEAKRAGWTNVTEERSYERAIDDPGLGEDMFDWHTHEGLCPECTKDEILEESI